MQHPLQTRNALHEIGEIDILPVGTAIGMSINKDHRRVWDNPLAHVAERDPCAQQRHRQLEPCRIAT